MLQVVLRGSPSALACASRLTNPADNNASPSSLILDDWRSFVCAPVGSCSDRAECLRAARVRAVAADKKPSDSSDSISCYSDALTDHTIPRWHTATLGPPDEGHLTSACHPFTYHFGTFQSPCPRKLHEVCQCRPHDAKQVLVVIFLN